MASRSIFGQLSVDTDDPDSFEVELRTATAGDVSLFDMRTSPHTVARRAEHIDAADVPYCKLSLQIHGHVHHASGWPRVHVGARGLGAVCHAAACMIWNVPMTSILWWCIFRSLTCT